MSSVHCGVSHTRWLFLCHEAFSPGPPPDSPPQVCFPPAVGALLAPGASLLSIHHRVGIIHGALICLTSDFPGHPATQAGLISE